MLKTAQIAALTLLVTLTGFLAPAPTSAREGFGVVKKTAVMTRIQAPEVYLPGTRIAVRVDPDSKTHRDEAERIAQTVETDLLSADPRLSTDPSLPDVLIKIAVLENSSSEQVSTREVTKSKIVGKDAQGNLKYQYYQAKVDTHHLRYDLAATFQVEDVRGGGSRSIHAGTFDHNFEDKFDEDESRPTEESLRNDALTAAAAYIVERLAPTAETFEVVIPKGSFKDLIALAENGHWSMYLQRLDGIPPVKKSHDEAYREYARGLAYEGLGYNAETPLETMRFLEQALQYYTRAIEIKPQEEYFLEPYETSDLNIPLLGDFGIKRRARYAQAPLDRVRTSMLSYEEIQRFQDEQGGAVIAAGSKAVNGDASAAPAALNNEQVIEMVKAELPLDVIVHSIETCSHQAFDISPQGLIQLNRAGAKPEVIRAVQQRARR